MTENTPYTLRRIFKSAVTNYNAVRELLQMSFIAELMNPGPEVWIVSPWVSNIRLLDNRGGGFDSLNPEWRRREIRLVDVAVQLMTGGSRLVIVTRPLDHNRQFIEKLQEAAADAAVEELLDIVMRDTLHTKGILTNAGLLLGSMNLTYSGLELNDEYIEYDIDSRSLANARLNFESYRDTA